MTLPTWYLRCQGRYGRSFGAAALCIECVECRRRTEIPEGGNVHWLKTPTARWCPERIPPVPPQSTEAA